MEMADGARVFPFGMRASRTAGAAEARERRDVRAMVEKCIVSVVIGILSCAGGCRERLGLLYGCFMIDCWILEEKKMLLMF